MPAEKPSNDQESSLQNTVTKKNDVLHQSEMVLRWAGICFQDLCLFKSYTAEKSLDWELDCCLHWTESK